MRVVQTAQPTIELCWDCWEANGGTCESNGVHDGVHHMCPARFDVTMCGATRCPQCGSESNWGPATETDIDSLYAEAWGISDPSA